jgi:uncharacterized protein (TIGR02391 family)
MFLAQIANSGKRGPGHRDDLNRERRTGMLRWALHTLRLCREMRDLAAQALNAFEEQNQSAVEIVKGQMKRLAADLVGELPDDFPQGRIDDLRRHIGYSKVGDYRDILRLDLPNIENKIDDYSIRKITPTTENPTGFDDLLHPIVRDAAIRHYQTGDFRHAVLDAITSVFDKIRERTGVDADGDRLINHTMTPNAPLLILSELLTDSGRNDQAGFMEIYKGFYRGVRNPKAHSLIHDLDLDATKAAQYMVLASILMRRVIEAQLAIPEAGDPAASENEGTPRTGISARQTPPPSPELP